MVSVRTDRQEVHATSVREDIASVTKRLVEVLGTKLVAFALGVSERAVNSWAVGERSPKADHERGLRDLYQVVVTIITHDNEHVARAWMIGANPDLGDVSPAEKMREGRHGDVVGAARMFVLHH